MRIGKSFSVGFILLFSTTLSLNAASMHRIEESLRDVFPSVTVHSSATFQAAEEIVGRSVVPGFRAQFAQASEPTLHVTYPRFYNDPFVASFGEQRVALRAVNVRGSVAETGTGKLIYPQPYPAVDAIEVPRNGSSEELLLLHDARAPLVYDYEIVEMRGVAEIVMDEGAIRFSSDRPEVSNATHIAGGRFTQLPRLLQIDRPWVVDASGRRSDTHARWTLIGDEATAKTLRLTVNTEGLSYPLVVDPSFSVTGSLVNARFRHTTTLLPNGKVLVTGGYNNGVSRLSSAELYDSTTGTFNAAGSLTTAREVHTATLLPNGKVLITAGFSGSEVLPSAEIYDAASGTYSVTGSLATKRFGHTATLLPNGLVLIALGANAEDGYLSSAELYTRTAGTFANTGSAATGRRDHTATLLANGKVLIAAGENDDVALSSAELYDPATGAFTATGSLAADRFGHTATLLPDGKVLITGGYGVSGTLLSSELYDPVAGTFSATGSLATARFYHSATLLPDGKVLISAGQIDYGTPLSSAELYDPASGTFSATGSLAAVRAEHTATLLPNGRVLIVGGPDSPSSELYEPATGAFSAAGSLGAVRNGHTAMPLPNGKVLIAFGWGVSAAYVTTAEVYDPAFGTFSPTESPSIGRIRHTATLLPNGKVLVAAGYSSGAVSSAELYDPTGSGTFDNTGSLSAARFYHTATLLTNGKVLVTGGDGSSGLLSSAEIYDPSAGIGTFSATGSMSVPRHYHTATLLTTGKVLIAGGASTGGALLSSAQLYDPETGTFSATGSFANARQYHTATLLPNGNVLIAGGQGSGGPALTSAQLYDPATGTFSATAGGLAIARANHTATLLPNGKVLITGGGSATAELYDPASRTFSSTASLATQRQDHGATLLPNGRVWMTGGLGTNGQPLSSTEQYNVGLGYPDMRRPGILSSPTALAQPGVVTVTGFGFRGDSESSDGSTHSSATNYPLLHLQRVDNGQTLFLRPGTWSDTTFTSTTHSTLADGHYRLTIITNGIPSVQRFILFTGMGSPATPAIILATTVSTATVALSWAAVDEGALYQVYRSTSINGPYNHALTTSATSATDGSTAPYTTYLYKVRALGHGGGPSGFSPVDAATTMTFTDPALVGVEVKAQHILELRIVVNAMRAAASLGSATFTDFPSNGVPIRALHITEPRSALNPARAAIGLTPLVYTDPTITPGSTVIKAAHVLEVREGTK